MKTESKIHYGDLNAKAGEVYDFTEITGNLDARGADTKTAFPRLTTVGGYLYARGADTKTAFPRLTTVGGYLDASGADTKTAFPRLKKENAGEIALEICRDALTAALAINGLSLADGVLARIVSQRGGVSRVLILGASKVTYVVSRDGKTAHGSTLTEARADLLVKIGNRDTTPFQKWTLETNVSLEEMIVAYRTITGACGQGVSHFLSAKNYPAKLSVKFVITETVGRYGHEQFKQFFSK